MLERCHKSFSRMLKMPVGVGFAGVPDEIGDSATATPASYRVTVCFRIETISSNGPFREGGGGAVRNCSMTFRLASLASRSSSGGEMLKFWRGRPKFCSNGHKNNCANLRLSELVSRAGVHCSLREPS